MNGRLNIATNVQALGDKFVSSWTPIAYRESRRWSRLSTVRPNSNNKMKLKPKNNQSQCWLDSTCIGHM